MPYDESPAEEAAAMERMIVRSGVRGWAPGGSPPDAGAAARRAT